MILEAIRRIINHKILFRLYPLIATDAEIERETGQKRTEIARISQELAKNGQIHYGRTINGNYARLLTKSNHKTMKQFIAEIKAHLEKVAQTDETFASKYKAKCESEENSVEKCAGYIVAEVQKNYKQGNSAVLTNDEVFGLATHYYDENLTAPERGTNCTVVMSKDQLTPEDEEAIRREARAAAEQKVRNDELEKIRKEQAEAERKKKAAEEAAIRKAEAAERKKKEEAERKRKEWETADLLFSFDED